MQEFVFEEIKQVGEIKFRFSDKEDPLDYVTTQSNKMQLFDTPEKVKDILRHQWVVEELDKERIQ